MDVDEGRDSQLQTAVQALNQILAFNGRHRSNHDRLPHSGVLYHYTTAEGLKGIVINNELWASSAYFLNDAAEVIYGYEIIVEVLQEWLTSAGSHVEARASIDTAEYLRGGFEGNLLGDRVHPVYLACFCEDGNLLSQWRAYGAAGGYALGFKVFPQDPQKMLMPEPRVYTSRLIKVEYERSEQIRRCREILDGVLPILDEPDVADAIRAVGLDGRVSMESITGIIAEILMEEALGFKDQAFSVEQEWRMVVRPRELLKQG